MASLLTVGVGDCRVSNAPETVLATYALGSCIAVAIHDPVAAVGAFQETMAGQSGVRNTIRGGGFFNIDSGVIKYFQMPYKETHKMSLRWESFNLTNTVRFDPRATSNAIDNTSTFGRFSGVLGQARQMQFALRYEF